MNRILQMLVRPAAGFARPATNRETWTTLAGLAVINAALSSAVTAVVGVAELVALFFLTSLVGGLVVTLILVGWVHGWNLLLGGRGLSHTFRVVVFGSTPGLLLGWIAVFPGFGTTARFLLIIWSFGLFALGLQHLGKRPPHRAWATAATSLVSGYLVMMAFTYVVITRVIPMIFALS
ncbi:MAG: hypothetical protein HY369_01805 [Candidatus Aenigmarchaeota archaeon]|nr:hypothetical protein [Candidatus Aenigmarchaeota archaeon]